MYVSGMIKLTSYQRALRYELQTRLLQKLGAVVADISNHTILAIDALLDQAAEDIKQRQEIRNLAAARKAG